VSVEAEVATLFEPACSTQEQVGYLIQDGETIKFTIWAKSDQSVTLREGDTVAVDWAAINTYQGEPTLAATSETRIEIVDRAKGKCDDTTYTEQDIEPIGACRLPANCSE
jgi:ssDNA-binding replication factor A large subunit